MNTKAGAHITLGSRNGYGLIAAEVPAAVVAVEDDSVLKEAELYGGERVITIYRTLQIFGDKPSDLADLAESNVRAAADYWWPKLREHYATKHRAMYYQPLCEAAGNSEVAMRNQMIFEIRLMELAEADGYKLAVGSLSYKTPEDFSLWEKYYVPIIIRAEQGGHIYNRHVYFFDERAEKEAQYLIDHKITTPMVLTEVGVGDGSEFPGVEQFMEAVVTYEGKYAPYDNIWAFCMWTLGDWRNGNFQEASPEFAAYLRSKGGASVPVWPKFGKSFYETLDEAASEFATDNPDAALRKFIKEGNPPWKPYGKENWVEYEGQSYAVQRAIDWTDDDTPERTAFCPVPEWNNVRWLEDAPRELVRTDGFDSPVGTLYERQSTKMWPGAWYDANKFMNYYTYGDPPKAAYHTGADLNLANDEDRHKEFHATANGTVVFADVLGGTWGLVIVVRHDMRDGTTTYSRYAHAHTIDVVEGDRVFRGQVLGLIGGAAVNLPNHLHFDISITDILETNPGHWPGTNGDAVLQHYTPPLEFITNNRPEGIGVDLIDVLQYMRGDGRIYRVQHSTGESELFQCQSVGNTFFTVKNSQFEKFVILDDGFIWRAVDTSPGPAPNYAERPGIPRMYIPWEDDLPYARWIPRYMEVGQEWVSPVNHTVQFYYKDTCAPSAANSGEATHANKLVAHHASYRFFTGVVLEDVIETRGLFGSQERMFWARGWGLVGWEAPWGKSAIADKFIVLDPLQRERVCGYG